VFWLVRKALLLHEVQKLALLEHVPQLLEQDWQFPSTFMKNPGRQEHWPEFRTEFALQLTHWLDPAPLQDPQVLWQETWRQLPWPSYENPLLHWQVPATRKAFDLQDWQVFVVPRQVRHLMSQPTQLLLESRKNPLLHLQTPPSRKALEPLHPKHWLKLRPLQVEQEEWQVKQFPLESNEKPLLQTQLEPERKALDLQERQALKSFWEHVLHLLLQLMQFPPASM
jgi:hypothetical protein